jgi:hypothetical protein
LFCLQEGLKESELELCFISIALIYALGSSSRRFCEHWSDADFGNEVMMVFQNRRGFMNTFQIVLRGGLTRNVAADRYRTSQRAVRFYTGSNVVAVYDRDTIITIDAVGPAGAYDTNWREGTTSNAMSA